MSEYHDIKKLCFLSRLEIEDSEIQQTAYKIKEIITFFNKLDEFEPDNNIERHKQQNDSVTDSYLKLELNVNDLRDDNPIIKSDSQEKGTNTDINEKKDVTIFNFNFHMKKNGYVIGPRI
jgi:aspartyl/glutamyl-tRNA(Asn/Gln) amidotransferase C subunit